MSVVQEAKQPARHIAHLHNFKHCFIRVSCSRGGGGTLLAAAGGGAQQAARPPQLSPPQHRGCHLSAVALLFRPQHQAAGKGKAGQGSSAQLSHGAHQSAC